jgi:hypothetical protein
MKKLFAFLMILSMASVANAELWLGVNDQVNPPPITLSQNQTAKISVWGDGVDTSGLLLADSATFLFLAISGPGSLDIDNAFNMIYPDPEYPWIFIFESEPGDPRNGALFMDISIVTMPFSYSGTIIDNIFMRCDGVGDVTLSLYQDDSYQILLVDAQVFHQIPEPMTMVLLGLGVMFLRKRKA